MGEMSTMQMPQPKNSISMVGGKGPYGVIDMGGMFTIVKVRDKLTGDPGWYAAPEGHGRRRSEQRRLSRDGITP